MKKATLETIRDTLIDLGVNDTDPMVVELNAELNKDSARKQANAKAYEALHDVIVGNLTDKPCTVAELWNAIQTDVPEGTTKGNVQYAVTHLWQDEIIKVEGKPNGYRKA